jgi:hypothetical protein
MANRFRTTSFVILFFAAVISLLFTCPAMAERQRRHHANDKREHILALVERRHHQRVASSPTVHSRRHRHLTQRVAATLTRAQRIREIRKQRAEKIAQRHELIVYRKMHLYRLFLDEKLAKEEKIEQAIAFRAHLAQITINRRERLAEMNGELASKSIRAFQEYVTNVPIRLISVDLNDPTVKVSALLARHGIGSAEPFSGMIRRSQPDVAVTGTFFSLDNLKPVGDIVINGGLAYFGGMGTALCITRDNRAEMVTVPWGHHHDWSNYDFVMACGPRLLEDHEIVLDPQSERFHDQHMLAPNSRIGVGITANNKLVFVMTKDPIYLGRLAKIMRELGCSQAMNLDAGTSTGFYYEGNMMASPGRWLTNAIVIYANQRPVEPSAS